MKEFINTAKIKKTLIFALLSTLFFISVTYCSQSEEEYYLQAIEQNNTEIIRQAPAAALEHWRQNGDSLLHIAVTRGSLPMTQLLVEKCPRLLTSKNGNGETPFSSAIVAEQYDVALWLLEQKPELAKIAAGHGYAFLYTEKYPLTTLSERYHATPALDGHSKASLRLFGQLLQSSHGENSPWTKPRQLYVLFKKGSSRLWPVLRHLIDENYIDIAQLRCLNSLSGPEWVRYLIQAGADPNERDAENRTVLERQIIKIMREMSRFLYDPDELFDYAQVAEELIKELYPWTSFQDKTAAEITALKQNISKLFGADALREMEQYRQQHHAAIKESLLENEIPEAVINAIVMP